MISICWDFGVPANGAEQYGAHTIVHDDTQLWMMTHNSVKDHAKLCDKGLIADGQKFQRIQIVGYWLKSA